MFCQKCGQAVSETAKFCEKCGAKLAREEAIQNTPASPETSPTQVSLSDRPSSASPPRLFLAPFTGLIAGICGLAALFIPWTAMRWPAYGVSADASAWEIAINAKIMGAEYGREVWACLALAGAVIAVLSSLLALAAAQRSASWGLVGTAGMTTGGLLLAGSALWALSDIDTGTMSGMTVTYGFGLYLALAGGIVACIAAVLDLLLDPGKGRALRGTRGAESPASKNSKSLTP